MKEYFIERLEEVNEKIEKFESKTYSIYDINMMVNDRKEYDRLTGEKDLLMMSIMKMKLRENDK